IPLPEAGVLPDPPRTARRPGGKQAGFARNAVPIRAPPLRPVACGCGKRDQEHCCNAGHEASSKAMLAVRPLVGRVDPDLVVLRFQPASLTDATMSAARFQATTVAKRMLIRMRSFPWPRCQQYKPIPIASAFTTSKPVNGCAEE